MSSTGVTRSFELRRSRFRHRCESTSIALAIPGISNVVVVGSVNSYTAKKASDLEREQTHHVVMFAKGSEVGEAGTLRMTTMDNVVHENHTRNA